MEIIISNNKSKPLYEQITEQVKSMIMDGTLMEGEQIPSMRALAKSLQISVITVQKAYEDLQKDGFIETTIGRGIFISAKNKDFLIESKQKEIEENLQRAVDIAKQVNISEEQLQKILKILYHE